MSEKKESINAQALRWLAAGESLQAYTHMCRWVDAGEEEIIRAMAIGPVDPQYIRIKPRTIKIGRHDVPEPMRIAPADGINYFVIDALHADQVSSVIWTNHVADQRALANGMCWIKREDAELAAKAITELLTGVSHD